MKKYLIAAALIIASFTANAQEHGQVTYYIKSTRQANSHTNRALNRIDHRAIRMEKRLINWLPEGETPRRFTIAVRPFQLLSHGLKADFEMELATPGQWVQFSLSGYHTSWYDHTRNNGNYTYYSDYGGWEGDFLSGTGLFEKLGGAGLGVAFKSMISDAGWYWNAGIVFTYYDVHHKQRGYYSFVEDGMEFYEYSSRIVRSHFYQTGFNVNIGKHFALSRNMFFDGYVGLGYQHTYTNGTDDFGRMLGFGYSGLYFSGGFRIGWMWPGKN